MGKVTVKEQAGNEQTLVLIAAWASEWMNESIQRNQTQLTYDHKSEKVSIKKAPQDWLIPGFHTHHSSDQVNKGNGLEGDAT